jgi:hypothetical protein
MLGWAALLVKAARRAFEHAGGVVDDQLEPRLPTDATMMARAYLLRILTSFEREPSPMPFTAVTT